ncbi:MAG: DUF2267 domain-containing protein [Rhizobium sp.]|nr:DUF2267 domain-containing protein [Rhizobium sp.]
MTLPFEYQNASLEFDNFMLDARDFAGLATTNMAWNMVVGVLHTFRRRLTFEQALRFAGVLPPLLRAILVEDWHINEPVVGFGTNEQLLAEVRSVRAAHNFSPSNAVAAVARALRRHVDVAAFEHVLATLPAGAQAFWSSEPAQPPSTSAA